MDIHAEKLHLIEQLARLQDVGTIEKIKEVLKGFNRDEAIGFTPEGTTITSSDLISRAEASNRAIKEGKTKSIDQVRENIKNW
ncbi:MAG: hypothetical protein RIG77_20215 [Cyclobacteriaceae bacterium]